MEHIRSRSLCHIPSTFYRSGKCRLRQTVSDVQPLVYTVRDLQQSAGHEQQQDTCEISPSCAFTEIKPEQQLCRQLYSQMTLLQEKVDRQDKVGLFVVTPMVTPLCVANITFLQRVSIACYAERCISYSKSVRPSVCPSHAGTELKRLKLRSWGLHWRIAP